jgi:hypothetical protein
MLSDAIAPPLQAHEPTKLTVHTKQGILQLHFQFKKV